MDAASILSSPTPVTVSEEGSTDVGTQSNEAAQQAEAANIVEGKEAAAPPSAPEPVVEKKEELISPKLAMLAKEERRLQEERRRIQEERKNPDYQEFLEFKKLKASAKEDPLMALEKLGLTYDQLTEYVISGKHTKDPSVRALEEKLAAIENERKAEKERAYKELREAQLNNYKEQIKAECLKASDEFELVNVWGAHNLVYNVIQEHYDRTEQVLPINEAAKKVEAYLEKESEKYQGSKKLRKLFGAPELAANKTEADIHKAETPTAKMSATLSNNVSNSTTSTDDDDELDPRVLAQKAARLLMR